ncbi:MAG: glycosyltransferase family 9 protein [Bdellovibrionales bacterium]
MSIIDCRHFNGYKPCNRNPSCDDKCPKKEISKGNLLIVHLDAMGAVLRSTALLPAIIRAYPGYKIHWITRKRNLDLLANIPLIDQVFDDSVQTVRELLTVQFDVALVIDKALDAIGLVRQIGVDKIVGFKSNPKNGAILPANPEATELWKIGLDDNLKFFGNQKTENRLVHEALNLGEYVFDDYLVKLTDAENKESERRKKVWQREGLPIIGINTGCADVIPAKKFSIERHRSLIEELSKVYKGTIVLLGGPEDKTRNEHIGYGLDVIQSPTHRGIRDGLVSIDACDVIFTGDSLGMHMAIGLKKWVIPWFGPTCAQEIELYGRGRKIQSPANCSPCWKRDCDKEVMCYDQVIINDIVEAIKEGVKWTQKKYSSYKQPLSEMRS